MRRPRARHLLLLVALLHLAADAAFAGGAVFCVGTDGHRALETEHLADAGCEIREIGEEPTLDSLPGDCTDSPVHPEADMAPGNQDPKPPLTLLALPGSFVVAPPCRAPVVRPHPRAPLSPQGLIAQRTTVLLL